MDLDKMYESLEFVIEGDKYEIKELSAALMSKISNEIPLLKVDGKEDGKIIPFEDVIVKQFCALTGAEEAKVKNTYDLRKVAKVIRTVSQSLGEDVAAKN